MTTKNPSTFRIDATEAQCSYLNKLSETNMRYRVALRQMVEMGQKELEGGYWGLSHQTLNEVQKFNGALDALRQVQWVAFSDITGDSEERHARQSQIKDWVGIALTENPDGMSGVNWFFPEENDL